MIADERRAELERMACLESHPSAMDLQLGLQEALQELRFVERLLTEARNYAFIRETIRLLGLSLLKSLIDQNGVTIALYQIGLPLEENTETIGPTFTPAFNSVNELEEFCRTNFRRILDFVDGSAIPVNGWWTSATGATKDLDRPPAEAGSHSDGAGERDQRERFFICARK
jgi:hypothetical protein